MTTIPAEAIEAAADIIVQGDRAACECRHSIFDKHDVNPPCSTRRQAMRAARIAIEAAAPFIAAQAFDEGQKSGMRHADRLVAAAKIGRPELPGPISPNPYRG